MKGDFSKKNLREHLATITTDDQNDLATSEELN